jgi:membrane protein implicated in regulation of membrane protease activity
MTSLTNWLSPGVMHSVGWALLHFLWQGTAAAALAAVLMTLFRRASARYVVASVRCGQRRKGNCGARIERISNACQEQERTVGTSR